MQLGALMEVRLCGCALWSAMSMSHSLIPTLECNVDITMTCGTTVCIVRVGWGYAVGCPSGSQVVWVCALECNVDITVPHSRFGVQCRYHNDTWHNGAQLFGLLGYPVCVIWWAVGIKCGLWHVAQRCAIVWAGWGCDNPGYATTTSLKFKSTSMSILHDNS